MNDANRQYGIHSLKTRLVEQGWTASSSEELVSLCNRLGSLNINGDSHYRTLAGLRQLVDSIIQSKTDPSDTTVTQITHMLDSLQTSGNDTADNKKVWLLMPDDGLRTSLFDTYSGRGHEVMQSSEYDRAMALTADLIISDSFSWLHGNSVSPESNVVYLAGETGMDHRLEALRAGVSLQLDFNSEPETIYKSTVALVDNSPTTVFSVLIIDDDVELAAYYSLLLRNAGMKTEVVNQPLKTLQVLQSFMPDIILIDLYMPDCTGSELASIIQQDPRLINIPILFLSSEDDLLKQSQAIANGGEGFLVKPVDPNALVTWVANRAKRSRSLQNANNTIMTVVHQLEQQQLALDEHSIVSIADAAGNIIYVNDKFCEVSKYARNELLGQNHRIVNSGTHSAEFFRGMWKTIGRGKCWHGIFCNHDKNGEPYWVDSTIVPFTDDTGKPYQYISIRTDITEMERLKQEIMEEKRFSDSIIDGLPGIFFVIRENGQFLRWNRVLELVTGHDPNTIGKMDISKLMDEATYARFRRSLKKGIDKGSAVIELSIHTRDGEEKPFFITLIADTVADQNMLICVGIDTSDITRTEEALRASEERLRRAQWFANIGIWDWDIKKDIIFSSERTPALLGYDDEHIEITYTNFLQSVHPDDRAAFEDSIERCIRFGEQLHIEHRSIGSDGSVKWLQHSGDVIRDESDAVTHMLGMTQEITRRKQAELAGKKQQELLDMLHSTASQAVSVADYNMVFASMLDGLLSLTNSEYGFIGEVLLNKSGNPYLKTNAITNISWNEETRKFYENKALDGMEFTNLDTLFGAVLTTRDVVLSNSPKTDPRAGGIPEGHPDLNAFLGIPIFHGDDLMGMYGIANKPGGYNQSIIQFLEPFNSTLGVMINGMRLTKQREYDNQALVLAKEEAEEANKAKSVFLSRMSHELRTPMNAILGFSQLLEADRDNPLTESQQDSVGEIISAGSHLLELINEVLDLTRIEAGKLDIRMEEVDVDTLVAICINTMSPLAQQNDVDIINETTGHNVSITADNTRLKQVIINLLSNAIKYNKTRGSISVSVSDMNNGNFRIMVSDTGHGIAKENLDKIFEPFDRLGAQGLAVEGTGIGLTITKSFVELMNGKIGVESQEGIGSSFWVEFPGKYQQKMDDDMQIDEPDNNTSSNKPADVNYSLLYVEDNPANLKLVDQILSRRPDIEMLSAHNAELGLELAKVHQPDLIVLDINLPGMNGFEALKKLKIMGNIKSTPIYALSANAMPRDVEQGIAAGFDEYLTKPLNVKQFLELVSEALPVRSQD